MTSITRSGPVVLTREPPDNDALSGMLRELGAEVLEWPAISTAWLEPPGGQDELRQTLSSPDWIVFTSRRAAEAADRAAGRIGCLILEPRIAAVSACSGCMFCAMRPRRR